MMTVMRAILAGVVLALSGPAVWAADAVVAVDAEFAPVAEDLRDMFAEATGYQVKLAVHPQHALATTTADLLLATDAALPARLAETGAAEASSLLTYAMGRTGTAAAVLPRDAVVMRSGSDNPAAWAFMDFLKSSEAWDLIVSEGYGAH